MDTRRHLRAKTRTEMLDTIRREFAALPGLRLSPMQAMRMWGLPRQECDALLQALLESGFLVRADDGTYRRADVAQVLERSLPARPSRLPGRVA